MADERRQEQAGDALHFAEANINPVTGLATDYLNHFNEAIMLLEMLPSGPEFLDDFLRWRPMSYHDYFMTSRFELRCATIAAYEHADPQARACLEGLADTMTAMLETTRAALNTGLPPAAASERAGDTVAALKPLVACAGRMINGEAHGHNDESPQAAVDDLMKA